MPHDAVAGRLRHRALRVTGLPQRREHARTLNPGLRAGGFGRRGGRLLADSMDLYQVLGQVGEGAYGRVFKGRRKHVGQVRSERPRCVRGQRDPINTTLSPL